MSQQLALMQQTLALVAGAPAAASLPALSAPATPPTHAAPQALAQTGTATTPPTAPAGSAPDLKAQPFGASARISLKPQSEMDAAQSAWFADFTAHYLAKTGRSRAYSQQHRDGMADPRVVTGFNPAWKDLVYPIVADRSTDWPTGWQHAATLLDGWRAVDGTIVRHGDRWWLFACVAETPFDDGGREFNELFLFHANDPLGPWHPHRQNPVVTDVRRARPAGPCFVHEGRLVRPAQDCAAEYGHRIVFNEVRRLDPDHYEEHPIGQLDPRWVVAMHGCHTYARHGTLDLLDAKFLAPAAETRPSRS